MSSNAEKANVHDIFPGRLVTWIDCGAKWMGIYVGDENYTVIINGVSSVIARVDNIRLADTADPNAKYSGGTQRVVRSQLSLLPPHTGAYLLAHLGMRAPLKLAFKGEVKLHGGAGSNLAYLLYFPNGKNLWVAEADISRCPDWKTPEDTIQYYDGEVSEEGWTKESEVNMIYYP